MLLLAIYITMAVAAAISLIVLLVRNKDILFPKRQK